MLGDKIKFYRKQLKISQTDLADKINCKQQVISRWEKNTDSPSLKSLLRISKALEISVNKLLEE